MLSVSRIATLAAVLVVVSVPASLGAQRGTGASDTPGSSTYPLDDIPRDAGPSICNGVELVTYRGTAIRLASPVTVHPAFAARLRRFEEAVARAGRAVYGRAPRRIHHLGGYACRSVRGREDLMSEHSLGNALDVNAFSFGGLGALEAPLGMPRRYRSGFRVGVFAHWDPRFRRHLIHAEFLHRVVREVADRGVFRVIYGPAHRGHEGHFHFDMAPTPEVDI